MLVQQAFVQQVSIAGQRATVSFSGDEVAQHDLLKALVNLDVRAIGIADCASTSGHDDGSSDILFQLQQV